MAQTDVKNKRIYVTHINIRQSIFFLLLKLIFLDVMSAILAILYFTLFSSEAVSKTLDGIMQLSNISFILALVLVKIVLAIYVVILWINEYYEIYPTCIYHKSGVVFKHEEKHPLAHIRSVKIEQSFLGKAFGFGTITIYDWYLRKETCLYLVHNPMKYFNIIDTLIPKSEEEKQIFQDTGEE
jgi:membrane protein YdbS with pleckstrin-like domain